MFIHRRVLMTSQRWAITVFYVTILQIEAGSHLRGWETMDLVGGEFTKDDWQVKQFFKVSKGTDIYVARAASEQQYILELSKSLPCYQNVAYLTRMNLKGLT